ncbi:MAG: T9SS type A sorting domain-containing protein [Candidatus Cloacimonadaceae bacterium]
MSIHNYSREDDDWYVKTIDFSNNPELNDFAGFKLKIEMFEFDDIENLTENNVTRFDNFLITGTPIHHFIPNRPNTISNTTITFDQGMADNITDSEAIPSLPNPNIAADEMESLALDLKGEGPWYLTLQNDKEYCAYHRGDTWVEVEKSDDGFKLEIEASTNRSANKLFIVFSNQQPTLPIELSSFSVSTTQGSAPKIAWETASETALNGYYVLRSENPDLFSAEIISPLIFAQNSSFYTTYEHEDETALTGRKYYYWLHVLELNQADSYAGPIVLHCPEEETQQPEPIYPLTKIRDIYPNPFNPSTNVAFELAQDNEVSFKIYNLRGKEVLRLDSRQYSKGLHHISIDSKTHDGRELPAGVYLLKMDAGGNSYLRKMTLLK